MNIIFCTIFATANYGTAVVVFLSKTFSGAKILASSSKRFASKLLKET